ncbi:acyl carrier protein [Gilvimarinus agarilyticus]|uniref:phosphopantetheine-binding protein n=1 Tax=unclassified Gilvimarinus TaxID=2642066 RepID=UPI001C089968|nr:MULTISPECIES: phosphopantetheine-binding protein [unclassified Gilvimarinus]MBU2885719.1 acyl carrier protein [Gilvimarinus agarilyticus]MDO6570579.1 phosphopantetheine-binding protein [Gilvimarinus sp. 2_MG-2023]MDO6748509.1 phosphopantetheine-binding protein [Gilvimarinus sp. 1_MG-2023]
MVSPVSDELKLRLKQIIIEECDKDELTPDDIANDEPLLTGDLDLDSLDVLQICMAVKKEYGVRIEGNTAARRALKDIDALAQTIADATAE